LSKESPVQRRIKAFLGDKVNARHVEAIMRIDGEDLEMWPGGLFSRVVYDAAEEARENPELAEHFAKEKGL
jgi:hypothetical protein